jgi:hypothetical protein
VLPAPRAERREVRAKTEITAREFAAPALY